MLEEGYLKEYVQVSKPIRDREKGRPRERTLAQVAETSLEGARGVINMIIGGESIDRESLRKGKAYVCQMYSVNISRHP